MCELNLADRKSLVASLPHGGVAAEIGVAGGAFSRTILATNAPRRLYLIDPWEHQSAEAYGSDPSNVPQVAQDALYQQVLKYFSRDWRTVSIIRCFSLDAAGRFSPAHLDWIHIDANHLQVRQDIEAWWSKVKSGGWITGHDYTVAGDHITVKTDVDAFVAERGLELFVTRGDDDIYEKNYPSWAFRKP